MFNIFTYGSLMFDPVWSQLVSNTYKSSPAAIHGYTRKAVLEAEYPVIFKNSGTDKVEGIIYFDVSLKDTHRLDTFEGNYYTRTEVVAQLPNKKTTPAMVYVLKKMYRHIASPDDWDPHLFEEMGIGSFIKKYQGFNR